MSDATRGLVRWLAALDPPTELVLVCAHTPVPRLPRRSIGVRVPGCVAGMGTALAAQALAIGAGSVRVLPCDERPDEVEAEVARWARVLGGLVSLGEVTSPRWGARGDIVDLDHPPVARRAMLGLSMRDHPILDLDADEEERTVEALRVLRDGGRVAITREPRESDPSDPGRAPVSSAAVVAPIGLALAAQGCVACGVCVRACPTGSLRLEERVGGTVLLQRLDTCRGTSRCVQLCPQTALSVCGPTSAQEVLDQPECELAVVRTAVCERCGAIHPASEGRLCPVCAFRERSVFGSVVPPGA